MVFWRERGCWKEEAEDVDVLDGVCNMMDMSCARPRLVAPGELRECSGSGVADEVLTTPGPLD